VDCPTLNVDNCAVIGIGSPRKVDRVETQKMSRNEGKHITANGSGNGNDWDAAWSDDEQDDYPSNSGEATTANHGIQHGQEPPEIGGVSEDDDAADAWGWGDEEPDEGNGDKDEKGANSETTKAPIRESDTGALREVTLTERYTISSMPDPVLRSITSIIEDGTILTKEM
jgi:protein transport protein DSL1/ZW10